MSARKKDPAARVATGVKNLDALLGGGLPRGSVTVLAGAPGAGKTILAQQMCFHNATPKHRAVYFNTLSEPTAKTLRYLKPFSFFDAVKVEAGVHFIDLGIILRAKGLEETSSLILHHVRKTNPAIVVVDSFKVFDDLARSPEELRKFDYELAVNLMAWETTALLIGEYGAKDITTNPLFSIVDGLIMATQRELSGEQQRFVQIIKMRGTDHSRAAHPFAITAHGAEVFASHEVATAEDRGAGGSGKEARCKTGIARLDDLLGEGIPRGSSLLVSGVAGTGKTVLSMEFIYRGALAGEKGILFSFEETEARLLAAARGLGWDLEREIARGMVEIVVVAPPDIDVEAQLVMMKDRIAALGAKRVAVDSISVFLHKVEDKQIARDKTFQLTTILQNAGAVGFLATDIPYGSKQISRFGVEETIVDGVILLTASEEGMERQRYLEVYKLRNTAHLEGRHSMAIGEGGVRVFPRYREEPAPLGAKTIARGPRLPFGVPGLDALVGGGLFPCSVTLVSGAAGIGKTTLALQYIADGAARGEPGLFVALEEGPREIMATAAALGLGFEKAVKKGTVEIVYLSREHVRPSQILSILGDKIRHNGTKRLALDSVSRVLAEGWAPEELRQMLYNLITRFKALGVTSLLTLESSSGNATDMLSDRGLASIADNVVLLRYAERLGAISPTLSVLKTRASVHDWGTYHFELGDAGARVAQRVSP